MFVRAGYRWVFVRFVLLLWMLSQSLAFAQLKSSVMLDEALPASVRKQTPTFILADQITSRPDLDVMAQGHVQVRRIDSVIQAQRMDYNQVTDVLKLRGDVRIQQNGNRYWGPELELGLSDFSGFFTQPHYSFLKTGGEGRAERIDFVSERQAIARAASYSTCRRPQSLEGKPWSPDWLLTAKQIDFDTQEDVATATDMVLRFKDVPILAAPTLSFPISNARQSGLLAPSFASDNQSGIVLTQPMYWNIAPNRDATLYPSLITKRGLNYGGEFRYLEPSSAGRWRADYLPHDKLTDATRWAYAADQRFLFPSPLKWVDSVVTTLKLNRVSDNQYWRDLPNSTSSLTQRLLNNELVATTTINQWFTQARLQRWQTLQDVANGSVLTPPYDRSQIYTRRTWNMARGLAVQLEGDLTEFQSVPGLTGQPNGTRLYALTQISKPWVSAPWGYLTPKALFHASSYYTQNAATGQETSQQRTVPSLSLDGGLFFERAIQGWGRGLTQTLEPRAYYVRTPYRNQANLPNYDSGVKDFNLATIYTENTFAGNDRISDMNMLTLGLNSKILDSVTGAQLLGVGVAQRFSYMDQQVTLPYTVLATSRVSDYLLNANARLYPSWSVDGAVQVRANAAESERTTLGTRYAPSNYRVLSAAYRFQKDVSEQLDVSWQWPLGDLLGRPDAYTGSESQGRGLGANRWYSVARLNYSVFDKRMVNAIAGFEYDADCWVGRVVLEKTQLDSTTANQRLMFQIEFSGFSRVGTSPLATLRGNIPRYQNLREQMTTPSRYGQYE